MDVRPNDAPLTGRNAENSLVSRVLEGGLASPGAPPSLDTGRDIVVECRDEAAELLLCASGEDRGFVKGAG